jgi:7,8-dihydropterin-6-yl-methyl-4-(beta-D-ribofuranosyl)aminobenzene 5'-phosphate synthase
MLKAVDRLEITILMDNSIDVFLPDADEVRRTRVPTDLPWGERKALLAEHGYSALVRVQADGRSATLLFDAGVTTHGLIHNMDVMEIRPGHLQCIVLSHGHVDHTQGLLGLVGRLGKQRMPVLLHPDAFLNRKVVFPDNSEIHSPAPNRRLLEQENIEFVQETGPSYLIEEMVLVTGQIHRTTDFEQGFPIHYSEIGGAWQSDPLIHDDQALVVNVRDKGLVVLTGCGHAGAINTIRYAQKLSGLDTVYALLGGLHLTGGTFDKIIPQTVKALQAIGPRLIVPGHCTGWKATHEFARVFPEQFVQPSVGTRLVIESQSES